ncbi:MAG: hypothetical protein AB8B57_00900 [Congregibacter sp.]
MKKILKYGFFGWLILSVLGAPFYWPYLRMIWVFNPIVSAPKYEAPSSEVEARQQDVDYLSTLLQYDRAFSEAGKEAFTEKLAVINSDLANMSAAQFYLAIAEAVALADNGHSNISNRPQYTEFNTIGARLHAFSDGVYIVSAAPDKRQTLGRRVVAVEDTAIEVLRKQLRKYRGGNETWRDLYSTFIIESPELLAAAGHADSSDSIELTLESESGDLERVEFKGLALGGMENIGWRGAWQALVPGGAATGFSGWAHISETNGLRLPRYLTNLAEPLSYALKNNGLYIRALPGFAAGDQSIKEAYKAMLADHPDNSLDYLVVDFRLHDGGDYTKSMAFAKAAPKAVKADGDIYIITGPNTFSAAIVTVAMLRYYAGDRGVIIGEQMGDREQFWAERGTNFQLPNSGYYINYATGYHDWEKGCKGEPYCFTLNEMHEVPAGSLAPEVEILQDLASFRRGEDVVMDWIDQQR